MHHIQNKSCRCSWRVVSIIERIDLGCASNLMRVLISLTAPWHKLQKSGLVPDELGGVLLLVLSDEAGCSVFVYVSTVNDNALKFARKDGHIEDVKTGSRWDQFGRCVSGKLEGVELSQVQCDNQFMWAWILFRRHTSLYMFYAASLRLLDTKKSGAATPK